MSPFRQLFRRSDDVADAEDDSFLDGATMDGTMMGLIIALICLLVVGSGCVAALVVLRRIRRRREEAAGSLPTYNQSNASLSAPPPAPGSAAARRGHRRTLTITSTPYAPPQMSYRDSPTSASSFGNAEKHGALGSPVPEIHITFPQEQGEKRSSRVVVVQITDNGNVGLEPYRGHEGTMPQEYQLPRYERTEGEFRDLDLEKMGGLKENDERRWG